MSQLQEIKLRIEQYSKLLPVAGCLSTTEAERRAGEFLSILAVLADWRHMLSDEKIKCLSVQSAVYAQELARGTAKTVTENKVAVEACLEYINAREALENIENDISYLKAYQEIFLNSHLFYRVMAKGENY